MLNHPTYEKLRTMRLLGMAQALEEQNTQAFCGSLSFEERLGLLVDRENAHRDNWKLAIRLSDAMLLYIRRIKVNGLLTKRTYVLINSGDERVDNAELHLRIECTIILHDN